MTKPNPVSESLLHSGCRAISFGRACPPDSRCNPLSILLLLSTAVLLLLTSPLSAKPPSPSLDGPPIGTAAPFFQLPDLSGHSRSLSAYAGKPVVLNFWAFWCDTWKAEMPYLTELADRREEVGYRMVAISVDGTRVSEFLKDRTAGVPFPVLLDSGGRVSAAYAVNHVPTVVILDSQGRVRYVATGFPGTLAVLTEVKHLVNEETAARQHARRLREAALKAGHDQPG